MSPTDNQVVIFVPGTMGSELEDASGNIWPGNLFDWIFGYSDSKLNRLLAIPLTVGDVIRRLLIVDIYDPVLDDLNSCGFHENVSPPTLYVCPYDWRRPVQDTTDTLAGVIDTARADHGAAVDIILIGHSQGGLLCRYYLESGSYNARAGFNSVRQLIMMGVPHKGLPLMLTLARGDSDYLFLDDDQIEIATNTDGLSFAYAMLPATSAEKMWENMGPIPWSSYDLFVPANALSIGLTSAVNLGQAAAYRATMDAGTQPAGVRYYSFVGTRKSTLSGAIIDTSNPGTLPLPMHDIERPDGGDGTVPDWSAWLPGAQGLAVGGKHSTIFKDNTLRDALAVLLGCQPNQLMRRSSTSSQLQLAELVVAPDSELEVELIFESPVSDPQVDLDLLQAQFVDDDRFSHFDVVAQLPISNQSGRVRSWRFSIAAPMEPGIYRLEVTGMSTREAVSDDFIVQDKTRRQR